MKKHYREENNCLNCGTTLEGKFCHNCGQENVQIKESFGHMMNHAISDYFHFDEKFFHTLKPLFFKPGFLTNEYMAGRRVQYLHPIKMYIFISLIYFLLLFQQKGGEVVKIDYKQMTIEQLKSAIKVINNNGYIPPKAKAEAIADLYHENGYIVVNKHVIKDTSKKTIARLAAEKANPTVVHTTTTDSTYTQYLASQQKLPEAERDGWFERYYNRKAFAINKQKLNIKDIIEEGLKHNFPKMMFLLLPLLALILLVTFWGNKKFYVEHLIYTFHLHCFLFLFLIVIMLINMIMPDNWVTINGWMTFCAVVIILWYIYKSLRAVYHRSGFRTITKMIGISFTYSIALVFCLVILLIITTISAV